MILSHRQHIKDTAVEFPRLLGDILLVLAYKPLGAVVLEVDLDTLLGAHGKVIVAGDLNSKHPNWGSRLIMPSGRGLHRYLQAYGPGQPTHYPCACGTQLIY